MAFSDSNLTIGVGFDLTNSPKDFNLTDNTDYSDLTYSDISGVLRAVDPSGSQFYNNTDYSDPDIDYNVSDTSAALGSLPLDTDSLVKTGTYQFTYSVRIYDMLQSLTIVSNDSGAKTFTVSGNQVALIQAASAANWECVDAVTTALTIISATYSSSTQLTTVTVDETLGSLTALAQFQWTVDRDYSRLISQAYSYETPSVCLNWVSDECCSSMTITDVTTYFSGATVTRLHTVSYPIGITPAPADLTSPLQEFSITPIWTGTWVDIFTADISATNGIITITDSVRGVKEHNVASDESLCQAYTCLANMSAKYNSFLVTAPQKAMDMSKFIDQASIAFMAYTVGKKCGQSDYASHLQAIFTIADSCGCGCSSCNDCSNTPTQVVGCCENVGSSDYTIVIQSTGGSLTVSSNTVGDTTTFELSVTGSWLTTQINNAIGAASIGDLSDVDVSTASPATGQVLVWNQGTGKWERSTAQVSLLELTDVDDTGLADEMIMYYDAGTQTFKFRLETALALEDLTDVTITAIATNDILKWNGSAWVNVDNFLSLLTDVNTTGIADGSALEWDTATSKWIIFTPKKTLESLDDVEITGIADGDRFQYNTGTGWSNKPLPAFTYGSASFAAGYGATLAGFHDFGYAIDVITNEITIRGAISNSNGASVTAITPVTLPVGYRPQQTIPFHCTVGGGVANAIAIGEIQTDGDVVIYSYYAPATGILTDGIPAGAILFSPSVKFYSAI